MKSRTKVGIIAIAVVLVVLLALGIYGSIAIKNFFQLDGVQILGQYAHINLQTKGFVVAAAGTDADAVGTETTITISGLVKPPKYGDSPSGFTGFVNVEAYPLAFEDAARGTVGYVDKDNIYIHNHYLKLLDGACEREYTVDILRSDSSVIVVTIIHETGSLIIASGNSKEEAMQNYSR